jgi:hypothetical protein
MPIDPNIASDPFAESFGTVQAVDTIVEARIADSKAVATSFLDSASATLDALQSVNFNLTGPFDPPPVPTNVAVTVPDVQLDPISAHTFGQVTYAPPNRPDLDPAPALPSDPIIPDFTPAFTGFAIPEPPPNIDTSGTPTPDFGSTDVTLPASIDPALPDMPLLDSITVPTFAGLTLPTFDATAPEFQGSALVDVLQWSEPVYHPTILSETFDKIRSLWSGGSGIPAAVELAMVERAQSREDMAYARDLDNVSTEFSKRGFTMPPGMMSARIDQMKQDLNLKKQGLNRELTIEFVKTQVENIRFAVTQSIAGEQVMVSIFLNMAQRMFEAAKFQIETQIQMYNAQVSLFNATTQAYGVRAQVFGELVRAELAKIEVFKAEVEAEVAKGQVNEQKVRVYAAQLQGVTAQVEIFKAKMQGASIQSEVIRNRIEAYKSELQAYAERLSAQKIIFDAYNSRVQAEGAKAQVVEAQSRAYAALVQGKVSLAEFGLKKLEFTIQKNQQRISEYTSELEAEKVSMQAQLETAQLAAQAYTADTQRFTAQAQAETALAQLQVTAQESSARSNVAYFQARVQAYVGYMEQLIRKVSTIVEALKSAGQIASTIGAGALAAVHVGANLSGSGGVTASGSVAFARTVSESTSTSTNENHNFEGT